MHAQFNGTDGSGSWFKLGSPDKLHRCADITTNTRVCTGANCRIKYPTHRHARMSLPDYYSVGKAHLASPRALRVTLEVGAIHGGRLYHVEYGFADTKVAVCDRAEGGV